MGYRIQNRRDTAARWAEINPILLEGEIGYVIDNPNQYKIGDGVSAWNNLPLRGFNGTIAPTLGYNDDAVPSQRVITERFDSQSEKLSELGSEVGKLDMDENRCSVELFGEREHLLHSEDKIGYISNNGSLTNGSQFTTRLYSVEDVEKVQIRLKYILASGANAFAFYTSSLLSDCNSDTFISGMSYEDFHANGLDVIVDVPSNAKSLLVAEFTKVIDEFSVEGFSLNYKKNKFGKIKDTVNEELITINSELYKRELTKIDVLSILENCMIYPNRVLTLSGYNLQLYDVSLLREVNIVIPAMRASGDSLCFSFYEADNLNKGFISGMTFTEFSDKYGITDVDVDLRVPEGSKVMVISDSRETISNWSVNNVNYGDSYIKENKELINGLKDDIYKKEEVESLLSYSEDKIGYISNNGSLTNGSQFTTRLYSVEDVEKVQIRLKYILASGANAFAFYTSSLLSDCNSDTFISGMSYEDFHANGLDVIVDVPSNAKSLLVAEFTNAIDGFSLSGIQFVYVNKVDRNTEDIEQLKQSGLKVDKIITWGDSITAGTATPNYPTWLNELLGSSYSVINAGCGSAWMQDISARQGGVPALIKSPISVPSGTDAFEMEYNNAYNSYQDGKFQLAPRFDISKAELAYNPVMIDGVEFNLKFSVEGNSVKLMVNRLKEGFPFTIQEGTPIYPISLKKYRDYFNIFFMGTNNTADYKLDLAEYSDTIIAYHKDCIASINSANYLVLGLFNLSYKIHNREQAEDLSLTDTDLLNMQIEYEKKMRKAFGARFINLRKLLSSQKAILDAVNLGYMTEAQKETNASLDEYWTSKGCAAYSLMSSDLVHPNQLGYKMIAYYVYLAIKRFIE